MRYTNIDLLRGLMLIILTIDHFGGKLFYLTYQSFGFVSALEGFIFLSGLIYGLVYSKYLNFSQNSLFKKTFKRIILIYKYHLISILFYIIILSAKEFVKNPSFITLNISKFIYGMFLLYQPGFLDILPIYILFLVVSPFVLIALKNNKIIYVIIISLILWILGQLNINYTKILPSGTVLGYANIFSFQIIFFMGLILGYYRSIGKLKIPQSKVLIMIGILFFTFFFICRHFPQLLVNIPDVFTERSRFSIIRLINFIVIAYLINILICKGYFIKSKYLEFLGRHSLVVFFFHLIIITMLPYIHHYVSYNQSILYTFLSVLFVISLYIPAFLHSKYILMKKVNP